MGLFDKRQSVSREEIKSTFKKSSGIIPKTGGEKYYQEQRDKLAKEALKPGYGSEISKDDFRKTIRGLEALKKTAKTGQEKIELGKKINYFKEIGGKKLNWK